MRHVYVLSDLTTDQVLLRTSDPVALDLMIKGSIVTGRLEIENMGIFLEVAEGGQDHILVSEELQTALGPLTRLDWNLKMDREDQHVVHRIKQRLEELVDKYKSTEQI